MKNLLASQLALDILFLPLAFGEFLLVALCLTSDFRGRMLIALSVVGFMVFQVEVGFGPRLRGLRTAIVREFRLLQESTVRHEPEPTLESLRERPPWQSHCAFFPEIPTKSPCPLEKEQA